MIVKKGNPVLRAETKAVMLTEIGSPEINKIIKTMSRALSNAPDGIGIAAPQVGISLKIFLASEEALRAKTATVKTETDQKETKKQWEHYVFINPKILKYSRKRAVSTEGCLSVPGLYGIVKRSEKVKIEAYDKYGKKFQMGAAGLFARLLQHEVDHLNGALFIDKAEKVVKIHNENK